ncbi:MAG TPA: diguanylate cyclase [Candidatus Limnocylindrales bacterium]|nr:diguanylate cyclase [Candidatus Limnocylindrales bacterium]
MIRALQAVLVIVPATVGLVLLAALSAAGLPVPDQLRLPAVLAGVGALALSLGGLLGSLLARISLARLVGDAERIAGGEFTHAVRSVAGSGLEGRLSRSLTGIVGALRETHESATVDKLTGVSNRQALLGTLFTEVERATRYNRPFSVAFVDIDHFKAVNDTYGHAAGDVVLRGVAQTIRSNLRATDTIGRYGGEEFMLLLTETDPDEAAHLAEKLRVLVSKQRFSVDNGQTIQVTISIGIAGGVGSALRVDALVRDADAAMYSAKSLGRNQTYVFAEPDEDARVPRAPISAAGRARAIELGRVARDAAVASLASVVTPVPNHRGRPSPVMTSIVNAMATQLDLPEAEIDRLRIAALLHDVGKVAVPDEVLEKPAPLTSAEWRTVVQHPRIAQVILEQAAAIRDAAPIVLHHHERYSGHGYPFGLRGNEIPLGARVIAIADAYDAMTHDRPWRAAMSHEQALGELRRHAGTQFDPELVALFCELYADAPPAPDPEVSAMTGSSGIATRTIAPASVTAATAASLELPLVEDPPPAPGSGRPTRARRRSDMARAAGATAPDDPTPENVEPMPRLRRR